MNVGVGGSLSGAIEEYCASAVGCDPDNLSDELIALRRSIDRLEVRFSQLAGLAADPDRCTEEAAAEFEESFLELRLRGDGGAWLKGAVDREGAAALKSALGPLARRNGQDDLRTQAQRNAHALVELAHHAL